MEIFKLFGSIFVDNDRANQNIEATDKKAGGLGETFLNGAKVVGAFALAVGAAAVTMVAKSAMMADDMQKALNKIQTSTRAADDEMEGLEKTLLNIYGGNFGESLDDVAESMSEVSKQTGLTGKALEEATTRALLMRDTFGMPIQESIRAVDMLTKQFGVTSEEAYTLMAQGAQKGLDKNGNLLDSVNEYSVHFKNIGLDAEDMFNSFANGAATGVFDVDKLGDAIKEFGIRSKDMSDASVDAFTQLGFNGEEMSKKFAAGGDTAKIAFEQVAAGLAAIEDPVKQNAIGVSLFGTQWEDVGAKGIIALTNLQGEISATNDTLDEINSIKYASFGEALAGIGRQFEAGIMLPLGQQVLPLLNVFANWIAASMPVISEAFRNTFNVISFIISTFTGYFTGEISSLESVFEYLADELLGNSSSEFSTWLANVLYSVGQMIGFFEENFTPVLEKVVEYITTNWPTIRAAMEVAFNAMVVVATRLWDFFDKSIMPILKALWDLFIAMMPAIRVIADVAFTAIVALLKTLWDTFDKLILPILGFFAKVATENIGNVQKAFEVSFKVIGDVINGVIGTIKSMVEWTSKAVSAVKDFFSAKDDAENASATTINTIQNGKTTPVTVPRGPRGLAAGGEVMTSGIVRIGETGPEDLYLPQGAMVMPLSKSPGSAPRVSVVITGNTLLGESDEIADRLGNVVVTRLRELGVF